MKHIQYLLSLSLCFLKDLVRRLLLTPTKWQILKLALLKSHAISMTLTKTKQHFHTRN